MVVSANVAHTARVVVVIVVAGTAATGGESVGSPGGRGKG